MEIIIVYAVIALAMVAFLKEWLSPDLIAMCALGLLLVLQIIKPKEAFAVFGNEAVITIACMFILSAGLERTGVIDWVGRRMAGLVGASELTVLLVMMSAVTLLSAFMNNTPIVVAFLPLVLALGRQQNIKPSKLLIPLSYSSQFSNGVSLMSTASNLVVNAIAVQYGMKGIGIFELAWVGIPLSILGVAYMAVIGHRLLPSRETLSSLVDSAHMKEFFTEAVILKNSPLVGKTLRQTAIKELPKLKIIDVFRRGNRLTDPLDTILFESGDRLLLLSASEHVLEMDQMDGIGVAPKVNLGLRAEGEREVVVAEGIISPNSSFRGKTIREINLRQRYGMIVLAVHRQGSNLRTSFEDVALRMGDTVLVEGSIDALNSLRADNDFLSLSHAPDPVGRRKLPISVGIVALVVLVASFEWMPIGGAALLGALAMVLSRCVTAREAYNAINWDIVIVICGMLGVGLAMEKTGGAKILVDGLLAVAGTWSPWMVLAALYFLANLLTAFISHSATAVLMTPLAIQTALGLGVDPRPFVMAMVFAVSFDFSTPVGYQTNTFVYGAGGYKFLDFVKVGLPLNILFWIAATLMIPFVWPFH